MMGQSVVFWRITCRQIDGFKLKNLAKIGTVPGIVDTYQFSPRFWPRFLTGFPHIFETPPADLGKQ